MGPVNTIKVRWPEEALVARVRGDNAWSHGHPLEGKIVEVSDPGSAPLFLCYEIENEHLGHLLRSYDLEPLNEYTRVFIEDGMWSPSELYPEDVYEIRDMLDETGVHATAKSINEWGTEKRTRMLEWLRALHKLIKEGVK